MNFLNLLKQVFEIFCTCIKVVCYEIKVNKPKKDNPFSLRVKTLEKKSCGIKFNYNKEVSDMFIEAEKTDDYSNISKDDFICVPIESTDESDVVNTDPTVNIVELLLGFGECMIFYGLFGLKCVDADNVWMKLYDLNGNYTRDLTFYVKVCDLDMPNRPCGYIEVTFSSSDIAKKKGIYAPLIADRTDLFWGAGLSKKDVDQFIFINMMVAMSRLSM